MERIAQQLVARQAKDGSWRFCYESGFMTDAYMIIILRILQITDEDLIHKLHRRIVANQERNGAWKAFPDEPQGNLSLTVESYIALLYSGYSKSSDDSLRMAKYFIRNNGGLGKVDSLLTNVILACMQQNPWKLFFPLPVEMMLIPSEAPIDFFEFSGYARVHLAPIMLLADNQFTIPNVKAPDLSDLIVRDATPNKPRNLSPQANAIWDDMVKFWDTLASLPKKIHQQAVRKAEHFMFERIETNGTLYSYVSATILMILALLSLRYDRRHPTIKRAVQGLRTLIFESDQLIHVQNASSTLWDTALISHSLQKAGLSAEHAAIRSAGRYLLSRQHTRLGDWSRNMQHPVPGGWGFSDVNTMIPDVDDTTAALRAIRGLGGNDAKYREAFNRGLQWIISMQNDDGGWPAFEKNNDNPLFTFVPFTGADSAAIDPSTTDLTGRTLEFIGRCTVLNKEYPLVQRAVHWLIEHQEADGSWFGRWGISFIYGTWAALTGMAAVGVEANHPSIRRGVAWLEGIQNSDGGWGESCASDSAKRYVPLRQSTLSQTAWAVDALVGCSPRPNASIEKGIRYLARMTDHAENDTYPTGAGLPGFFYTRYHSYSYIWPLLALGNYAEKYG